MRVLIFDVQGKVAHFRRPDTTQTHATYPFITRTAIRGLLGSMLGLPEFLGVAWTGLELRAPVRTVVQELSLLGKGFLGNGPAFSRPTAIELIVNPSYRIYYHGDHQEELARRLREQRSHYHTYLGSAFALTFPRYVDEVEMPEVSVEAGGVYTSRTVVPTHVIERLIVPEEGNVQYGRAGGVLYRYLGDRRFRGAMHLIYEVQGRPIRFQAAGGPKDPPVRFVTAEGGLVALW